MSKEEVIKLLDEIDFEVCVNFTFTYIKKVQNTAYMTDKDRLLYEPKTITFQKDYDTIIDTRCRYLQENIDFLDRRIISIEEQKQ